MSDVLSLEREIGSELVALLDKELHLSVDDDLAVRVRIYAADRKAVLVDIATTAKRALNIAALFIRAAHRADPSLGPSLEPARPQLVSP